MSKSKVTINLDQWANPKFVAPQFRDDPHLQGKIDTDEFVYEVTKATNTLEVNVGQRLRRIEVADLIDAGYTVNITSPK